MTKTNDAVDTVDGSSFSEEEYELAIANDIEVTGYNSDEPKGEAIEEGDEQDVEEVLEVEETNEAKEDEQSEPLEQEATSKEADEDPFGSLSEDTSEQGEDEEEDEFKSLPKSFKKRLKRENRKVGRLERELQEVKSLLTQSKQVEPQTAPNLSKEHFATEDEYINYLVESRVQQSNQKAEQESLRVQQERQKYEEAAKSWQEKVNTNFASEEDQADFYETVQTLGDLNQVFSEDILKYVHQHKNGPKMLKYFAERPQAVAQVNNIHPYELPSVLGKVSDYVSQKPVQVAPQPSKAPVPTGSLTNKTSGSTVKSIDKMSDDELIKAYESGSLRF